MSLPLELALVGFVIACAAAAALLRDVLAAVIAFSAYSLGVAIIWVVLRAPDVALTEAAVGAGVMTVLLLLTIARTVRPVDEATLERVDIGALAAAIALVAVLSTTLLALPPVGAHAPGSAGEVSAYYLENAYEETGVQNVVTAVLASYRGFDTLGEAVVVYAAGAGILVVLQREVFG